MNQATDERRAARMYERSKLEAISEHRMQEGGKNARCEHRAGWRETCKVRTPCNANNNGAKWQRMNIDYDSVLCAVFCFVVSVFKIYKKLTQN